MSYADMPDVREQVRSLEQIEAADDAGFKLG